jgi:hypothetical protein
MIAGSVVAGALIVPMSIAAPPAGALSNSPFCQAVFSWAKHPVPAPTSVTINSYHAWAKLELKYFEKMQATAPNAKTKQLLTFIVTVLKSYATYTTLAKLTAYQNAHRAAFTADESALTASIAACA